MPKRLVIAVLTCALFACSQSDPTPGTVFMEAGQRFEPTEFTIQVNQTVTWTNSSQESHTVTAYEDELPEGAKYFTSGDYPSEEQARDNLEGALLSDDQKYEITFEAPGTYRYFCIPHESQGMVGTIVVEE
jgi:plastocyanin